MVSPESKRVLGGELVRINEAMPDEWDDTERAGWVGALIAFLYQDYSDQELQASFNKMVNACCHVRFNTPHLITKKKRTSH